MPSSRPTPVQLAAQTWLLAWEAGSVIWMRSWVLLAGGPQAAHEGQRMIDEKVAAALTLWPALFSGGVPASPELLHAKALAHYAKPVRDNRRRLSGRS